MVTRFLEIDWDMLLVCSSLLVFFYCTLDFGSYGLDDALVFDFYFGVGYAS